ncbi:MAG: acyl-ACP--UDP-N-acetylglucosamine O-acyltransferase [Planctomycetota bacterium]|jgi:UDP-N-acetylglucosamine acyltransferase
MPTNSHIGVHPTAVIDPEASVHPSVRIGPYCVIGANVTIGEGCILHNHVTIEGKTTLGFENVIYPFAVIGAEPQDLKFKGDMTELIIGDRNRFREHVTLHRGTEVGGGKTVIGSDCLLMVGAHIAHDCVIEDQVVIANQVLLGGHTHVEFGATIAGGAGLHHFTSVGKFAFVGGLARISKDVPPFLVVEGNPAEPRKVNTTAMVRRGWDPEEIEAVRQAFKRLFRKHDQPMQVVMDDLRAIPDQFPSVVKLCDSIERTQLGVHGRYRECLRDQFAAPRHA